MNIGIVGLGLIGGSIGLDLRALKSQNNAEQPSINMSHVLKETTPTVAENRVIHKILGVSRREQTCEKAIALGIVDEASVNLSLMAAADVIFICTPLSAIVPTMEELLPYLLPETIVTDVGSVKTPIVDALSSQWPNFVGAHPMAGTESSGVEAAQLGLFKNRPYVITPTGTTPPIAIETVAMIAQFLQAKIYQCSPEDHDRAVSWISHLPVMISASLIAACMNESDPVVVRLAQQLASSGFRDTSRVGGGNPELGVMMAQYNRTELLQTLQVYQEQLQQVMALIQQEDWLNLENVLTQTKQNREQFVIVKEKG